MTDNFFLLHEPQYGRNSCEHAPSDGNQKRLIAITGGPGAGKTALMTSARHISCSHVAFVPESATLLFSGGFWRRDTDIGLQAAQTAIFQIQRQLERMVLEENLGRVALCDRGTVDCVAYWPKSGGDFWSAMHSTREAEWSRYHSVIHLRTPSPEMGYDLSNQARTESAELARDIDERIADAWDGHPRRFVIEANGSFQLKLEAALRVLESCLRS